MQNSATACPAVQEVPGRSQAEEALAVADGQVRITVRWEWDGVSVYPACDGPIKSIRLQNLTGNEFVATLPNARRAGGRAQTIAPFADVTISAKGTLKSLGLESYSDTDNANLTIV